MKSSLHFRNELDETTLDAAWRGIGVRRARVRRVRRAMYASPIVAALALVLFLVFQRTRSTDGTAPLASPSIVTTHVIALASGGPMPEIWSSAAANVVALDDGSHLELAANARLRTGKATDPTHVDLALDTGSILFDIKPGGPRAWTIDAGTARVRVLGTRFTVARDGEHVHVSVERGKVRVESTQLEGGSRDLIAGQRVDVGGDPVATPPAEPTVRRIEDLPTAAPPVSAPHASLPNETTSQQTSQEEKTSPAASAPEQRADADAPSGTVIVETAPAAVPVDRMVEADAARKAGLPTKAIGILTNVVDHAEPNAPLAAFTIGKIYSEELGDASRGAAWFERAIQIGLPVGLDEDAHARTVECYGRAGRLDDASHAAIRYRTKFPSGRHLARVTHWIKE